MEIKEKLLAQIWQHRLVDELVTDSGDQLKVVHPGRRSIVGGCDFQDANFALHGKMMMGNIELHVRSSQWYSHGHHRDPKYNAVALHVVWWHDSPYRTLLQNGKAIPTSSLNSCLKIPIHELNNLTDLTGHPSTLCPKAGSYSDTKSLNDLLDTAGDQRFAAKRASFFRALRQEEAGQVLFRGIARALGYAQNAAPCEELTGKLNLGFLEKASFRSDDAIQALILGAAGLLPSQRPESQLKPGEDETIDHLEAVWHAEGIVEPMRRADWCFFRVRPDNFPTRRLVALSHLLARYHQMGLLRGILQMVKQAPQGSEHGWLEKGLVITEYGYWRNHFDFGIAMSRSSALIGREKASAIVINAVLPFTCAWSQLNSQRKLKKKATEIYRRYPALGDNELTRYMMQQLSLKPNIRLSARKQQGLIHIFQTYCRRRDCVRCPAALSRS